MRDVLKDFLTRGALSMNLRFTCVVAACLAVSHPTFADEPSGVLHRLSCSVVRFYVAKYSAPAAEQWARSKGASDAEIEAARRCLTPDSAHQAKTGAKPVVIGSYGS
jgi:hypothetical protein